MRIKPIITLTASATLVAGMSLFVAMLPVGMPVALTQSEKHDEEKSIEGAIRSMYSMRLNEATGTIEPEWFEAAMSQADAMRLNRRANKPLKWESMGPDNVGGRLRAFLIHKDSNNVWFAGSVSGGLFRSFTKGQSWTPINDKQENLSVTCIAQNAATGTIFYGTGEGGFVNLSGTRNGSPAFLGGGMFKSTNNRGVAFNKMTNTSAASFMQCNSMVAHPTDDKIYVSTEDGIYEFTNDGANQKKISVGSIKELKMDKNGVLWASTNSGSVLKMDAAGAMKVVNSTVSTGGRTSIAISPEDPNYVYLMGASNTGSFSGLFRTTDGGVTWNRLMSYSSVTDIFGSNRQGWYDNVVSVDPANKDKVYGTFDAPWNTNYVHADKHMIAWDMSTKPATIIVGSDGGLHRSFDGKVWTPISRGFTSLQLYNVAANELGHMTGGAQDNGTQLLNFSGNSFGGQPSKTAIEIYGGDGFDVEFSRFSPKTVFVSTYYGNVARSANSGQSTSTFFDDRQPGTAQSDFNTTFCLWESGPKTSRLFLAKNSEVWMANNPTDFAETVSWYLVGKNLGTDRIIEMDYSADGDHLFLCKSGRVTRIDSINSATFTFPSGLSGRTVTSVNVDQMDAAHVVITLGGYGNSSYVYETNNALDAVPTWKNITGNLPSIPVYDAVIDVDDNKRIILGTDLGIWYTEDGGSTWVEGNDGMARVPVFEIRGYEWRPWEGMTMYIGTHGRGFFRSRTLLTSTKNVKDNTSLKVVVYPNPTSDRATVSVQSKVKETAVLRVVNLQGQVVLNKAVEIVVGENSYDINLGNFPKGYYFATVKGNTNQGTVKVCVQ
ncbi:MAG: hypothetical protein RL712_1037 [Bacteroidota bacterium]